MDIQEIEVTIGKDGQVIVHVRGAKGSLCLDLTRDLEHALGDEVLDRHMTPDSLEDPDLPATGRIEIKPPK